MNLIFPILMIISVATLAVIDPGSALSAMTDGAEKGIKLSLTLIAIYSVWLGVYEIAEQSGLTQKLAKRLYKPVKLLFGNVDDESKNYIALNVSANILGIGGIATPMGIEAVSRLNKNNDRFAITMLLVVASTSLQIFPASVIALRAALGSTNASSIVLPALLSTLVSSLTGILLVKLFVKR